MLERRTPLKRTKPLSPSPLGRPSGGKPRTNSSFSKRRAISPASVAQREKVKTQVCAVIECASEYTDPAHLAPRAMGRGCDSPLCVIALCRAHHEAFDLGKLDLLPHLAGRGFGAELAHMQEHYEDPLSVLVRLSGTYWVPDTERSAA